MIKVEKLTKIFDQRGIAGIHGLSLDIPKGEIFALMGPNGSGKTTLLNLLSQKLGPDSGKIDIQGSIHFFEKREFEKDLNVQRFLIEGVTLEIDTDKKIQLSRDMADIFEFTYQLRQTMGQLSQGQLQKILMARELINKPDILFLDEPFIHLDPMSRKDILALLFTFLRQSEVTVVWITHEKDEALRFADSIGLIQHGKLEQIGAPIQFLQSPRNLFVAQFFGHQNFIKINKDHNLWITPWGPIASSLEGSEGFLIVPPSAWKIDDSSSTSGVIVNHYPQFDSYEIELEVSEKRFKLSLPLASHTSWKTNQTLKISPDLNQCLVISL